MCLPFEANEFSVVMGLQYFGRSVMENLKEKPVFVCCLAQENKKGKLSKVIQNLVIGKTKEIVACGDCSEVVLVEFKRAFVAIVLMSVLFPTSHFNILNFLQWYLDDIDDLRQYNWGVAVNRFICESMKLHEANTKIVDGCMVGVVVPSQEVVVLRVKIKWLEGLFAACDHRNDDDAEAGRDDDPVRGDVQSEVHRNGPSDNVRIPCGTEIVPYMEHSMREDVVETRGNENEPL